MLKRAASYRPLLPRLMGVMALILLALSAYFFRYMPLTTTLEAAVILMVAGGVTLLLALYLNTDKHRDAAGASARPLYRRIAAAIGRATAIIIRQQTPTPPQMSLAPDYDHVPLVVIGGLALALLTVINGNLLPIPPLQDVSIHIQFAMLLAGIAFTVWGLSGESWRWRRRIKTTQTSEDEPETQPHLRPAGEGVRLSPTERRLHLNNRYWVLGTLFLITLMAFAVRAWQVGTAVHYFIDEMHFSSAVLSFAQGNTSQKLLAPFSRITAFPWLFPYMQWGFVSVLGRNLDGLRALCVVIGTLGVPALYFLARTLFDVKTALVAALLLATFPPHIQFSRIGLNNIADPLFGTLMLAFLIRGLKFNRRLDFALAGAALGLTQYFYEGGRLLFPALLCLSLAALAVVWPGYVRRRWGGLAITLLAAAMIALPVYITLIALDEPLDARFQTVGIGGSYWLLVKEHGVPQTLEQHILIPLLVYAHYPEVALYYGGEQGMVLPYLVPFLLAGAFTLVFYWRSVGIILVMWVLLTSMGNMLMTEAAVYARYVVAFPALALLTAVGLRTVLWLIWPGRSRLRTVIVIVLVAAMAAEGVRYYFGPHLYRYNQQIRQHYDSEDALFRSLDFPWGTQIHIITDNSPGTIYLSNILSYLADGLSVHPITPQSVTSGYLEGLARGVDQAFFIEPDDALTLELLRQHFTLEGPFTSPYNVEPARQLVLYYSRYGAAVG